MNPRKPKGRTIMRDSRKSKLALVILLGGWVCLAFPNSFFFAADRTMLPLGLVVSKRGKVVEGAERPVLPEKDAKQPAKWKIMVTGTGGDLGVKAQIYEIAVSGATRSGTLTLIPEKGEPEKKLAKLPEAAVAKLWKVMNELDAMNLPDFSEKGGQDSPTYTIQLEVAGKAHTIRVEGYSQSKKHLKLILAIQKCYIEGVAP
jgi:hypothetical protein